MRVTGIWQSRAPDLSVDFVGPRLVLEALRLPRRRRLLVLLATGLGVIPWIAYAGLYSDAIDARAYFSATAGHLYTKPWGAIDAYVYSPAFSQLMEPLRWLGHDAFLYAFRLLEVGALALMAGPLTGPLIYVYPVPIEVGVGNIHLLLGLAVVAGFRWPAAWSFVLLTKITPGVGLLWFVVRREWRNLAIALGATAAVVAVSFAIAPGDWFAWIAYLAETKPPTDVRPFITAPLWIRLPVSAAIVIWGARTDRRWTVLAATFLALPTAWITGLAMFAGLWALRPRRAASAA